MKIIISGQFIQEVADIIFFFALLFSHEPK